MAPHPALTEFQKQRAATFVMISQNRADAKREVLSQHQWQVIQRRTSRTSTC